MTIVTLALLSDNGVYSANAAQAAKGVGDVDFFERWLHLAPDGGDGSLEYLYVVVALAIVATIALAVRTRRARRASGALRRPRGQRS